MLKQLKSDDRNVTDAAQENFETIGESAVQPLVDFLHHERKCRPRVRAAEVLVELAPDEESIVPTMVAVIKTYCYFSPQHDLDVRREAAYAIAELPDGIRALTALMTDKDAFVRQTAVFPFDDITETLAYRTPEQIQAVKEALPALIRARNDKDRIVREVAEEVLGQIDGAPSEILRDELKRLGVVFPDEP